MYFWFPECICRVAYQKKISLLLYRVENSGEIKRKKKSDMKIYVDV